MRWVSRMELLTWLVSDSLSASITPMPFSSSRGDNWVEVEDA